MPKISELPEITSVLGSDLLPLARVGVATYGADLYSVLAGMLNMALPEQYGAAGDGVTDDTDALEAAIATGKDVLLRPGSSYLFNTWLLPTGTQRIVGDRTSLLIMGPSFSATTNGSGATSNGIKFDGCTGGGAFGFTIKLGTWGAELATSAIYLVECEDTHIKDVEAWNFSKSLVFKIESCHRCDIMYNYIHDVVLDSGQADECSAIDVDDARPNGGSTYLRVCNNRIQDVSATPAYIALWGNQCDGIHIAHYTSYGHQLNDNVIINVGEGFDFFSENSQCNNNLIENASEYGIKMVHGQQNSMCVGNRIFNCGRNGIVVNGTDGTSRDVKFLLISDNHISGTNSSGEHDANTTSGIRVDTGNSDEIAEKIFITNNFIVDNGNAKFGLLQSQDSDAIVWRNNYVDDWLTAEFYNGSTGQAIFSSAIPSLVIARATVAQAIPNNTVTKVNYLSEGTDYRNEWSVVDSDFSPVSDKKVMIHASIYTTATVAGTEWELFIYKNGSSEAQSVMFATDTDMWMEISAVSTVVYTDTIDIRVRHNQGGAVNLAGLADYMKVTITEVG
jgi:hypothetical protein